MAEPVPLNSYPYPDTPENRDARLAWERERLAEAEDDIANGRVISGDEAMAWLKAELAEAEAAMLREAE
jgi:hypothetical protein